MGLFTKKINKEALLDEFLNNIGSTPSIFEEICLDYKNNTLLSDIQIPNPDITYLIEFKWMDEKAAKAQNKTYTQERRGAEFMSLYQAKVGPFIDIEVNYKDLTINFCFVETFVEASLWYGENLNYQNVDTHQEMTNFSSSSELYTYIKSVIDSHFNL